MNRNRITTALAATTGSVLLGTALVAALVAVGASPAAAAANDYTGAYSGGAYVPDGKTDSSYLPGNHFDDWAATGAVAGATLSANVNSVLLTSKDTAYIYGTPTGSSNAIERKTTASGRTYIKVHPSQVRNTGLLNFDLLIQGGTWDSNTDTLTDELGQKDYCHFGGMAFWSDNTTMTCFANGNGQGADSYIYVPYFDNAGVAGTPAITVRIRPGAANPTVHNTYTVFNQGANYGAAPATQYACALCGAPSTPTTPGTGVGATPNDPGVGGGSGTTGRQPADVKALVAKSGKRVDRSTKAKISYRIGIVNDATNKAATGKVKLLVNGHARVTKTLHSGSAVFAWDPPRTFKTGRTVVQVAYLGDGHTKPIRSAKRVVRITR